MPAVQGAEVARGLFGGGEVASSTALSGVGMVCGSGRAGVGVVLFWWLVGAAASEVVGGLAFGGVTVLWLVGTLWVSQGGEGLEVAPGFFGGVVFLLFALIPDSVVVIGRGGEEVNGPFSGRILPADLELLAFIVRMSPVCWIEEPLPGGGMCSVVPMMGEGGGLSRAGAVSSGVPVKEGEGHRSSNGGGMCLSVS